MKYILMAFQPKWIALIMNGKKKVEVRTRIPECLKNGEPVTVLGYCAKATKKSEELSFQPYGMNHSPLFPYQNGSWLLNLNGNYTKSYAKNGLVVCKFVVETYEEIFTNEDGLVAKSILNQSCLTQDDIDNYWGDVYKPLYALHLTALTVFDKPMPLSAFKHEVKVWVPEYQAFTDELRPVTRAPQSWMYIAEPAGVEL